MEDSTGGTVTKTPSSQCRGPRFDPWSGGMVVKNPPANGDLGSIPGSGRSPGEGNGNPLQYSCLENPMDRGAWWATVHGASELDTTKHAHRELDPTRHN